MRSFTRTAPILALAATLATAVLAHDGPMAELEHADPVIAGDLVITQAWSRATPPGAATGAGYLTIANTGVEDDRLIAVSSDIAQLSEVHEMAMTEDRMMMRAVSDGLPIPAGETVLLAPGGLHMMFVGLESGIADDQTVTASLTFERAGTVTIEFVVFPIGSAGPDGSIIDIDHVHEGVDDMDAHDAMEMDSQ